MMITIGYITSRPVPRFDWLFSSLKVQLRPEDKVEIVLVDFYAQPVDAWTETDVLKRGKMVMGNIIDGNMYGMPIRWIPPKPTVWAGPHRITRENWWAAANARNTALCHAHGEYWVMLDDRSILQPGWMAAVRRAEREQYAVCGPYEKRTGVTVERGHIKNAGIITGEDDRLKHARSHWVGKLSNPYKAPGAWFYGCTFGVPTDWALRVNGFAEDYCDSLSAEDYIFGACLEANGFPIFYDTQMAIVEDRTPEFLGPPMKRTDKGVSPNDKSHKVLEVFAGSKTSKNSYDISLLRKKVLAGEPFPMPTGPRSDWYDGQFVASF